MFVAPRVGTTEYLQVLIAPGIAGSKDEKPRSLVVGHGGWKDKKVQPAISGGPVKGGYRLEIRIPVAELGLRLADGTDLAFQFFTNDRDVPFTQTGDYAEKRQVPRPHARRRRCG
ncbi:MAG TPA: hypothetical protein VGN72_17580 [Tepidisphaeraceae bacterium]|nr:hypothetical protein [Tepidisphaeraceae bacterium]